MVGKSGTRRRAPKSMADAMPGQWIAPGRKAGEDHARSQCPLRGEAIRKASQPVIPTKLLVRISILVAANLSPSRERSEGLDHAHS